MILTPSLINLNIEIHSSSILAKFHINLGGERQCDVTTTKIEYGSDQFIFFQDESMTGLKIFAQPLRYRLS